MYEVNNVLARRQTSYKQLVFLQRVVTVKMLSDRRRSEIPN